LVEGSKKVSNDLDKVISLVTDVSSKVASIEKQSDATGAREELYRPLRYLMQSVEALQRQVQGAKETIRLVVPDSGAYGGVRIQE
jgi:uncharacterized protein YoxC